MPDEATPWRVFEYEGFDIHVLPQLKLKPTPSHTAPQASDRYVYIGFIRRHGAHAEAMNETLQFHADGDEEFKSADDAVQEARHIGRSIIDGTHPDISVLPLVSHHHPG
jgi:hypothetical protein